MAAAAAEEEEKEKERGRRMMRRRMLRRLGGGRKAETPREAEVHQDPEALQPARQTPLQQVACNLKEN